MTRAIVRVVLSGALMWLTAAVTFAQTTSTTAETKKFQIIAVEGNQLVVKLPEGTRELTVPDDFRFNVDGKLLSVHELKPGMTGTATVTTKTTVVPVTVTEVKNGTVMHVAGTTIIVRTDEGNKMFTQSDIDKRGIKIMREGQPAQISDFRANDRLTATIITTKPPRVMSEKEVQATLARSGAGAGAPAAAAAPAASTPQAAGAPAATSGAATSGAATSGAATSGAAPKKLPKTASPLPVLGFVGLASLVAGLGLTARRRRATR
jgi:LPXTG-motif cell wall-anchored protein